MKIMEQREQLGSRLGFLLLSAGCAIGLGNVWRFPYITGAYGGAVFVGVYLLCLLAVLPVMIMEFAVGRASRSNMGRALKVLPPEGTRWHIFSKIPLWGSYLLSMFYTTVTGWMLAYCWHSFSGNLSGLDAAGVASFFGSTLASPFEQVLGMTIVVGVGCLVCAMGVQKGVEYAILTDEISRAWSGMSTRQYKNLKGLKKENLRDNMTTLELVLNMLAEATTTEISKQKEPATLSENIDVARAGGKVAGDARKAIETQTGVPVITSKNAAQLSEVVTNLLEDAGNKDEYITKDYNTV